MKIGIVTIYYGNMNYGANLQAYALCEAIRKIDPSYQVEQISYHMTPKKKRIQVSGLSVFQFLMKGIRFVWRRTVGRLFKFLSSLKYRGYRANLARREAVIAWFNQNRIPHSRVYNDDTIDEAAREYDAFIAGSDQVWNPLWYTPAYRLDFVPQGKIKFSYAASISRESLSEEEQIVFRQSLSEYTAVSVREKRAVELLAPLVPKEIEWVVDPTLLLSREDWDMVAIERLIPEKYVFCYFLGDGIAERELAAAYARVHGLLVVTIPFLLGTPRKCDIDFGDKQLYEIAPSDFLSLIKHAECIFTDSFHATLFSGIYHRQYIAFGRSLGGHSMSSRLQSLLSLYEAEDHFCDTSEKATVAYIEALPAIDYTRHLGRLEELKARSLLFLRKGLEKAEMQ